MTQYEAALERLALTVLRLESTLGKLRNMDGGNGVHLYWRLEQPFVIDDAGPSIPVHIEPIQSGDSRKKARRYVLEGKDRVYLDQRHHLTKLSPKALQIQDILAGIAEAIGGDHTTDLTRLLRVPGTYNRKDQRNGRQPVLSELIECTASRSYALDAFSRFHKPSATTRRQRNIDAMPLPAIRKSTAAKSDKLSPSNAVEPNRSKAERSLLHLLAACPGSAVCSPWLITAFNSLEPAPSSTNPNSPTSVRYRRHE